MEERPKMLLGDEQKAKDMLLNMDDKQKLGEETISAVLQHQTEPTGSDMLREQLMSGVEDIKKNAGEGQKLQPGRSDYRRSMMSAQEEKEMISVLQVPNAIGEKTVTDRSSVFIHPSKDHRISVDEDFNLTGEDTKLKTTFEMSHIPIPESEAADVSSAKEAAIIELPGEAGGEDDEGTVSEVPKAADVGAESTETGETATSESTSSSSESEKSYDSTIESADDKSSSQGKDEGTEEQKEEEEEDEDKEKRLADIAEEREGETEGEGEEGKKEDKEETSKPETEAEKRKKKKSRGIKFGGEEEKKDEEEEKGSEDEEVHIAPKIYKRKASIAVPGMMRARANTLYSMLDQIEGDFIVKEHSESSFDRQSFQSFISGMSTAGEEEEGRRSETIEEEPIDREELMREYKELEAQKEYLKKKNAYLQRKLTEHFKKRKMEHVLIEQEGDDYDDMFGKYKQYLETYKEKVIEDERERAAVQADLEEVLQSRTDTIKDLDAMFERLQDREREVAKNLVLSKTGKEVPEKLIERLLKRQRLKAAEMSRTRLMYMKLKDRVTEKENAIKSLDKIGSDLHLIDYEQLRMENQSYSDKIEEREEELTRLRLKCMRAIQTLAHVREKSSATENDISETYENLNEIEYDVVVSREQVNDLKRKRDRCRAETVRIKQESGLLSWPRLLRDMQSSMERADQLLGELDNLKEVNLTQRRHVKALLKNIDKLVATGVHPPKIQRAKAQRRVFGRPSICKPTLPPLRE